MSLPPTPRLHTLVPAPGVRGWCPGDSLDFAAPFVWTVDNLLDEAECRALIDRIEADGPARAPITTAQGFVMDSRIRNNTRVMWDDPALAAKLYARVAPFVPATMCGAMTPVGANERWRCYRYEPGQYFAPHYDGAFVRDAHEESLLTFIVYLNDDFTGGETAFNDFGVSVRPKAGQALLFQHRLLHESTPLVSGTKYAARSDILYRAPGG